MNPRKHLHDFSLIKRQLPNTGKLGGPGSLSANITVFR